MRLWHYCCDHSVEAIKATGTLRPNSQAGIQPLATQIARSMGMDQEIKALPVVWLTDLDIQTWADVEAVGLTSPAAKCNRVEFRFRVPGSSSIRWWPTWADENAVDPKWRALLELNCRPAHWWVSETPLRGCRLDERYVGPINPAGVR